MLDIFNAEKRHLSTGEYDAHATHEKNTTKTETEDSHGYPLM